MKENHILYIFDTRIANEGRKEEMIAFAKNELTMKQVSDEPESIIRNAHGSPTAQQHSEEE